MALIGRIQVTQRKKRTVRIFLLIGFLIPLHALFSEIGVYKHIDLSDYDVEECRLTVGDMTGDGRMDYLFFDGVRTIKAFDHEGNLLWEKFNPDDPGVLQPYHSYSLQIYDIDLDGKGEALIYWIIDGDYSLAILDGTTGKVEVSIPITFGPFTQGEYYVKHSIAIANVRGLAVPQDILAWQVHTMELFVFAYKDNQLEPLWHWKTDHQNYSSGRWAYPYDIDDDGKDEVIAGIDVLDENGIRLWKLPGIANHPDAIVCGDIHPDNPGKEIVAIEDGSQGNNEGLYMYTINGDIIWEKHDLTSEGQEVCLGNFRSDIPGLEMVVFAEDTRGFVHLCDKNGTVIEQDNQKEGPRRGLCYQIDWDGDRKLDEIYTRTGIFDGHLTKISSSMKYSVVQTMEETEFSPIVVDVQGDHREEIIWYDSDEMIILYNSEPLSGDSLPSPWNSILYRVRHANKPVTNSMYFNWLTLANEMDTIPPNAPTNLRSFDKTQNSLTLSWTAPPIASDGDSASFYRVLRNNSLVGTPNTTLLSDTGLMENTTYVYAIFSVDDNNNQSVKPVTGNFKTLSSSSDLYATVSAGSSSMNTEKAIPILLVTSERVIQVPTPLILKESDGSETHIHLLGQVPSQSFSGILDLNDSVAEGPAFFCLPESSLLDTEGNSGNTIAHGDSIYIDKTPPTSPISIRIRK